MDVRVDARTTLSLWSHASHGRYMTRSRVRVLSRVPVVQAFRLTWALPVEVLMQNAAIELWAYSKLLRLRGTVSSGSTESAVWPQNLRQLVLDARLEIPVEAVQWPTSLLQLSFGDHFNQSITGVAWPATLRQLSFGYRFNQPIVAVVWPTSLRELPFGRDFNHPIAKVALPSSMQQLSFGRRFNQPIEGVV